MVVMAAAAMFVRMCLAAGAMFVHVWLAAGAMFVRVGFLAVSMFFFCLPQDDDVHFGAPDATFFRRDRAEHHLVRENPIHRIQEGALPRFRQKFKEGAHQHIASCAHVAFNKQCFHFLLPPI